MPRSVVSRATKSHRRKVVTSVNLEPDVVHFLKVMQDEFDRDRSYLVNALVKDFQRRRELSGEAAEKELFARHATR